MGYNLDKYSNYWNSIRKYNNNDNDSGRKKEMQEIVSVNRSSKAQRHKKICSGLTDMYISKNHDYGDSFSEGYKEDGIISVKTRLMDKYLRFKTLIKAEGKVKDESIIDTLLDMANYAIMAVIEMEDDKDAHK